MTLLFLVGLLEEIGERLGFGIHSRVHLLGSLEDFVAGIERALPLAGGGLDLRGDALEVFDLLDGVGERPGFGELHGGFVFPDKWRDGEPRPGGDAEEERDGLPDGDEGVGLEHDPVGQPEEQGVAEEERPLGDLERSAVSHTAARIGGAARAEK